MDLCFQNFNFEKLKDMQHEFIKNLLAEVAASVSEIPALPACHPSREKGSSAAGALSYAGQVLWVAGAIKSFSFLC